MLLRLLYPQAWRSRCGAEGRDLQAERRVTLSTRLDLLIGALDVNLNHSCGPGRVVVLVDRINWVIGCVLACAVAVLLFGTSKHPLVAIAYLVFFLVLLTTAVIAVSSHAAKAGAREAKRRLTAVPAIQFTVGMLGSLIAVGVLVPVLSILVGPAR